MTSYHVDAESAPLTFDLGGGLECTKVSLGPMDNNGYLLVGQTGPAVWIDAADEADRILEILKGRDLGTLVTTHRHHDHVGATADVMDATGAVGICGGPDRDAIERATGTEQKQVWDGSTIQVGEGALEVIGLVGHTPGSIALVWTPADGPTHIFSGDSLFPGGPGKTNSPEDFTSLLDDLVDKVFDRFPDDTVVHPGHGDATTLGAERPQLGEWRTRGW
ncbi:MBL fold metallo-hydrolase [Aestuariimicrobium sp. p3-SID1156]|uniref:MBL fold metallo-hydrolase n=1 Tax=Aestuariimicrobium sp. p3-SID1156 TaxID=2916038 RepID=UPI00223AC36C|nr:MBL fold metallo-hydrolase [Aestuariimicrobium sp. p3-SID1156]MCT1459746.1 MBL fold metallo-hydrolase [Aestuariimicrobium sp. p3-SID1156]